MQTFFLLLLPNNTASQLFTVDGKSDLEMTEAMWDPMPRLYANSTTVHIRDLSICGF